jgi:hypothetical protein
MMDDRIEEYRTACFELDAAKNSVEYTTKKAWPIGAQIWSYKFSRRALLCTVVGYRHDEPGAIVVRNNESQKLHTTYPFWFSDGHFGAELARAEAQP